MKRLVSLILVILMLVVTPLSLLSCSGVKAPVRTVNVENAEQLHKATKGTEVKSLRNGRVETKGVRKNIEITSDFTVDTTDDFFSAMIGKEEVQKSVPGRVMEDSVINGNGHTITITGTSDGTLGRYASGLFGELDGCEVRNLHVVYDLEVNLISPEGSIGGICGDAWSSNFTNCSVTYLKGASFMGEDTGGIGGFVDGSVNGCKVTGDFKVVASSFGCIAGTAFEAKNCIVNASVDASGLNKYANIGGLLGSLGNTTDKKIASGCTVTLSKFSVSGQASPEATSADYFVVRAGGLFGTVHGEANSCLLEFADGATVSSTEYSTGERKINIWLGLVSGGIGDNGRISNIFVNAKGDGKANLIFPDKSQNIALGLHGDLVVDYSSKVSGIFFAEDVFALNYSDKIKNCIKNQIPNSKDTEFSFNMLDMPCTARVCRDEKGEEVKSLLLTVDGIEYNIKEVWSDESKAKFSEEIDGFSYEVTVDEKKNTVEFSKRAPKFLERCGTLVTDYSEINFGSQGAWSTDASGKPILK